MTDATLPAHRNGIGICPLCDGHPTLSPREDPRDPFPLHLCFLCGFGPGIELRLYRGPRWLGAEPICRPCHELMERLGFSADRDDWIAKRAGVR